MSERTEFTHHGLTFSAGLAATVRARRKTLGLTQVDLGMLAGVSPSFLNDLESGKESVVLDRVLRVLNVLGVELVPRLQQSPRARREAQGN